MSDTLTTGRPGNLNFGSGVDHCCVTLLEIRERNPLALYSMRAEILALVTTYLGQQVANVQQLMDIFKLTPAEARFVRALVQGESINEYATHEGVKRSTLASHVLVSTLPAIRTRVIDAHSASLRAGTVIPIPVASAPRQLSNQR